jgi:hypothetical protein
MEYILLGTVVSTYLFLTHVQPYLELRFEVHKNKSTIKLEREHLLLEADKCEVMRAYPEMYKEQGNTVVEGFQFNSDEEIAIEEVEEEEIEDKKIGYKLNNK